MNLQILQPAAKVREISGFKTSVGLGLRDHNVHQIVDMGDERFDLAMDPDTAEMLAAMLISGAQQVRGLAHQKRQE